MPRSSGGVAVRGGRPMFGSLMIEVALGIVFIYLTVSLACSALVEFVSVGLHRRRAKGLASMIRGMFRDDEDKRLGEGLYYEFYNHPMVESLAPRTLNDPNPTGPKRP